MATRVSRWWRNWDQVDQSTAAFPQTRWNILLNASPIYEGFTLERVVGYHRAYIIPVQGDPTTSGAILTIPNVACVVYDDGTDPNLANANIAYVRNNAYDKVLWQRTWTWTNLFGFDYISGLAPGLWDDASNPEFDVRAARKNPEGSGRTAYLRYISESLNAIGHSAPRNYHPRLSVNILVSTPLNS